MRYVAHVTWSEADLTALKSAYTSGVLTVEYAGPPARRVTYQSLEAIASAIADIEARVARAAGQRTHRMAIHNRRFE